MTLAKTALSLSYLTCKIEISYLNSTVKIKQRNNRKSSVDASFCTSFNHHLMSPYDKAGIIENICGIYREIMVPTYK